MASEQNPPGRSFSRLNIENFRQHIYSGRSPVDSYSEQTFTGETSSSSSSRKSSINPDLSIMLHIMENIPTRYDINRNPPRHSRNSKEKLTCSQQSVLSAIDRFVKAVNNMDATVLIPSRLRDIDIHGSKLNRVLPPGLSHTDLYSFYNMLKDVKNELLWGPSSSNVPSLIPISYLSAPRNISQLRQTSDDGLGSSGSTSDPETDSDFESVITDRGECMDEQTSHLATAFRHHLQGLHAILHQLADSADYLTARYQEDIEAVCSGF